MRAPISGRSATAAMVEPIRAEVVSTPPISRNRARLAITSSVRPKRESLRAIMRLSPSPAGAALRRRTAARIGSRAVSTVLLTLS